MSELLVLSTFLLIAGILTGAHAVARRLSSSPEERILGPDHWNEE